MLRVRAGSKAALRHPLPGLALLLGLLALAGCASQPLPALPLETQTPTLTLTPSLTPVWFPATETPSPAPSLTLKPTEEMRPGIGDLIASDNFSGPGGWQTTKNENGTVAYGKNELSLAVSSPKGSLFSLRSQPLAADFYLEITAAPSLCLPADIFGLMLRARSERDGYRLLVRCSGDVRLERLVHGELVVMQDWTRSGEIPLGGLVPVRLGVWAQGRELRVFVDGAFVFSARDPVYAEGQVGVLARSAGGNPLTVSFTDLKVNRLDASRIPTLTPSLTPTP